ncbi:MAG: hypothetical protein AAGF11_20475 [Myxococcota bacterium]
MSDAREPSTLDPDDEGLVPRSGAAVLRLRTRESATASGHALLIGSPLDNLGGVQRCLERMVRWLMPTHERVEGPLPPTKANIEAQIEQLRKSVEPGDQVLIYYAGHSKQALPDPKLHDQPVSALLPINACESTPASSRLIPGNELIGWLEGLADACKAKPPGPRRTRRSWKVEPSVTMVFECCHSACMMGDWPRAAADCEAIVDTMGRDLEARIVRGGRDPLPQVVRVMASGRDEWAQGPSSNDVGLMTDALVTLLERHPDEPWWAVIDRLQTAWKEPTQHPQVAGPDALIPLAGLRLDRPEEFWPCRRVDDRWWRCALAKGAGVRLGQRVVLTTSLSVAEQAHGVVEHDEDGALGIRVTDGSALAGHDFAWATRPPSSRRAIVDVWGGEASARAELSSRLERCAKLVRNRGTQRPAPPHDPDPSSERSRESATPSTAAFELSPRGVLLRDRWGDLVASTGPDDRPTWEAWLTRLVVLDEWLAIGRELHDWPADAFDLRWGSWQGRQPKPWREPSPLLSTQTPLWIELSATLTCVPAFVSLFRVRADRVVEAMTPHLPEGLPVTGRYPLAGLGDQAGPLKLDWPPCLSDDGPRWEQLVVMISDQPLPLVLLQRGSVRPQPRVSRGGRKDRGARLQMLIRPYRLTNHVRP